MEWVAVKVMYMLTRLIDSSPVLHLLSCPVCVCLCVWPSEYDVHANGSLSSGSVACDAEFCRGTRKHTYTHTQLHTSVTGHEYLADVLISCHLAKLCLYDILLLGQYKLRRTHRNTRLGKQYYHCQHNFRTAQNVSHIFCADCAGKLWNSGEWI